MSQPTCLLGLCSLSNETIYSYSTIPYYHMGSISSHPERVAVRPEYSLPEILSIAITASQQAKSASQHNYNSVINSVYQQSRQSLLTGIRQYSPMIPIFTDNKRPGDLDLWWIIDPLFALPHCSRTALIMSLYQRDSPQLVARVLSMINGPELYCCFQDVSGSLEPTIMVTDDSWPSGITVPREDQLIGARLPLLNMNNSS